MDDLNTTADELLAEFESFMRSAGDPYPADTSTNAGVFVNWHQARSADALSTVNNDDIVEFLLGWIPENSQPISAEEASTFCFSIGAFLEFLGDTGRLNGGHRRGVGLSHLATSLASALHTFMADSAIDPKTILYHPGFNPKGKPTYLELLAKPEQMPADKLEAELLSRMTEFQTQLADEQAPAIDGVVVDEPAELPFVYVPPPASEVESVAAAAPLLGTIGALRDYLGSAGKPLTDRGNIKRADGKALIALLDTGDQMDPQIGDQIFRTSTTAHLPGLTSIVDIAKEAGAVRVHKGRLVGLKNWSRKSVTDQATAIYDAIIELGPLSSRRPGYEVLELIAELLDSGVVHWLAGILGPGGAGDVDELVELVTPMLRDQIEPYWPQWKSIEKLARSDVSRIFQTLADAGVVEWTGRREVSGSFTPYRTGGVIRLTALGRHVVPRHLEEAGYHLRRVDDIADAPAHVLIATLDMVTDEQRQSVIDAWQPSADVADRIRQIVDFVGSTDGPALRLKGIATLDSFDSYDVGLAVRVLLDGPAGGHAALYLLSRGLADETEVGDRIGIGEFIDVLAASLDNPDELCELFSEAPNTADQYDALDQMWRYPSPYTEAVLDTLGRHHPDRKLAKAARKSAMRHRSWKANHS
ncbi:hypothetical protein A5784_30600 [Mycobacterium sp. 852013-50091_SCH5140682]|uniref:hypothetical protein n=1 Tax=Mycobacterium sp. 852013-50091_SCH5140682 TaxID=1834109 RepID=UPI0007EAF6BE|nr:hypothetical protein [Mycobacterium sp. 852013-50091_SCH5140682]OBC14324.1 hypothetical protein A5784_30600 [Mycobacterium sp. 852013-50091_SCH5140682]